MDHARPVGESWDRIETWPGAHAPVTFAALAPPAERAGIAAAEEAVGSAFPEPLRESLLRLDGTGGRVLPPPFWELLGAADIANAWRLRTSIEERSPWSSDGAEADADADAGPWWWHRLWIPVAADGSGDYPVVDQRPSALRGRIGVADHEEGCRFSQHPAWASVPALLSTTSTALETGGELDGCAPFVDSGELDWDIR
ncbi:hypothetical protein GCM10023224_36020 [Streptomonospora halophila]|uniref:Knr4/Smi1-like domain-containing protein n=1 Tax=Streptomonospora halophila TaxID=427369 RepID=A0ABP9GN52_9ACTN